MEAKITDLENELAAMKTTFADSIAEVQRTARENQTALIQMMERVLGKQPTIVIEEPVEAETKSPVVGNELLDEFRRSVKKVELPAFTGDDPAGWISRAETYFRVKGTSPAVKVSLAQLSMEGSTIHFFNSLLEEKPDLTWEDFRSELLERYGGLGEGDVYEKLTDIRQKGTVEEYIQEFERLTAQIPRIPDKQFLGYFLHGLKDEIRGKVRSFIAMGPITRSKLFHVTIAVERETSGGSGWTRRNIGLNRNHTGRSNNTDWVFVKNGQGSGSSVGNGPNVNNGPKGSTIHARESKGGGGDRRKGGVHDRGFTHISYHDLVDRKQKGLCYKCGGPFHPLHQCPDKQLRVMVLDNEDEEEEAKLLAVEVEESEEEQDGEISVMNLYEMGSGSGERLQTMKLQATINGVPVVVLVDSGATHNFIARPLVSKLGWHVESTPDFRI
ncbi:retrotransposon-related protein, partial [Trifolium pratense]